MAEIASLYATIGADTDPFKRAMNGVDDRLNNVGRSFNALGSVGHAAMIGVGAAVAASTAALVGFGAAVISSTSAAADMEQQIADISAVMGLTGTEAEQVGELINNLGLDPNLKVSATEAGAAIEMLARNGLELQQIMDGAAQSTVLLGNATGGNFSMAADVATDAMAQFGIKAENMMTAVNGIVGVTVASKFTLDDYRLAIAQAGGVASSVGVSFRDFNATIAATAPSFASGSDAGTSFKTFLQMLIPKSKEAEAAMQALGIITADGANQFFDASGNMKDMADIVTVLNNAFGGLTEEQKINTASTIFGTDAMRTAFELAGMTAEQFNALAATIEETDAAAAAATRMNTLAGAMEILGGVVETIRIQIGQKFLPLATRLTRWATDVINRFSKPLIDWFGRTAESVGAVVDRLTRAFDVGGLSGVVREVQNLGSEFASAFAGWAGNMWQQTQVNLKVWFDNVVTWVTDASRRAEIMNALTTGWTMFADWAGDLYEQVIAGAEVMFAELWSWVSDMEKRRSLLRAISDNWVMFGDWAGALWDSMSPHMFAFIDNMVAWISSPATWGEFGEILTDLWIFFSAWANRIWRFVKPELDEFAANVAEWIGSGQAWQDIVAGWTMFADWAGDIWAEVQPKLAQFGADFANWVGSGQAWQSAVSTWTTFSTWAGGVWATVQPKLIQFGTDVWKWITDAGTWQRFHDGVATRWTAFSAWAGGVWTTVQPKLIQFGADVRKWIDENAPELSKWIDGFNAFGDGVLKGWGRYMPQLEARMTSFVNSITADLDRLLTTWQRVFGGGNSGDGDLMASLGDYLGSLLSGLGQTVLFATELLFDEIIGKLEQTILLFGAIQAAMGGDWDTANELMSQGSAVAIDTNPLANYWDELQLWWEDHQSGGNSPAPGGRSETINVYVNGQAASGDVRAFARLGVTEALRARGAQ